MSLTKPALGYTPCPRTSPVKSKLNMYSCHLEAYPHRQLTLYRPLANPRFRNLPGKRLTQKECQQQSNLGPKLFRRTVELCRHAKDLDESQINFTSLVREFGGEGAIHYMEIIYQHFRKSCFDAGIVNDATWNANHILVVCAVYCWTCDRVFPVSLVFL